MMLANIAGKENDNAENSNRSRISVALQHRQLYIFNIFIHFKKIRSKNECYLSDGFEDFIFFVFLNHFNSNKVMPNRCKKS